MAARGDKSLSTSGFLSTLVDKIPYFEEPATLLASVLQPSQTMALCCPRYIIYINVGLVKRELGELIYFLAT